MTLWMLWSTLFAATVGIAALAIDRAASGFGAPRRHIWMVALIVSALVPVLLAARRANPTTVAPDPIEAQTAVPEDVGQTVEIPTSTRSVAAPAPPAPPATGSRLAMTAVAIDRVVLTLWLLSSCMMAVVFGRSMLNLRRQRREWIGITLGEHRVLLSSGEGPAVIGFAHPSIVVPRWALSLDRRAREMMLRHESEHIRARDPHALLVAAALLVALPWNAGIWWLVRRMKMAMELDCDARVIRSVGASRDYALMLLEVGERHSGFLPLASTLASGRPLLERRIQAMSMSRPRRPLRAAIPFLAIAVVATTAAARSPRPGALLRPVASAQQATPAPATSAVPIVQAQPQIVPSPAPAAQPRRRPVTAVQTKASLAAAPTPSSVVVATTSRSRNPDRARIATLAREHLPEVVRGDTTADYVVMVFDAGGQYQWSTHGLGGYAIEVAGDARTATERAEYNREHRAELMGAAAAARGGGRGVRGAGDGGAAGVGVRQAARFGDSGSVDISGALGRGGRARGSGDAVVRLDSALILPESLARIAVGRGGRARGSGDGGAVVMRSGGGGGTVGGGGGRARGRVAGTAGDSTAAGALELRQLQGAAIALRESQSADGSYLVRWMLNRMSTDGVVQEATLNAAAGLEEAGEGRSGITGILATAVGLVDTYVFPAGELTPRALRIVAVHLTAGTSWKVPD